VQIFVNTVISLNSPVYSAPPCVKHFLQRNIPVLLFVPNILQKLNIVYGATVFGARKVNFIPIKSYGLLRPKL